MLGRWGVWLGLPALALVLIALPLSIRQAQWLLESERILEETADPVAVEVVTSPGGDVTTAAQSRWIAGDTLYIQRQLCLFKLVRGTVGRAIIDTAYIPLPDIPIENVLYLEGSFYDDAGRLKAPPWCFTRLFPITTPAFMAPGPATLRTRLDVDLNPLRPHVIVALRPVSFTVIASPLRKEVTANREILDRAIRRFDQRLLTLTRDLALLLERQRVETTRRERLESYVWGLDAYLRGQRILPRGVAEPPKP